MLRRNGKQ